MSIIFEINHQVTCHIFFRRNNIAVNGFYFILRQGAVENPEIIERSLVTAYGNVGKRQSFYWNVLVDETVDITSKHPFFVGNRQLESFQFGGRVPLPVGSPALRFPRIRGSQYVCTFVFVIFNTETELRAFAFFQVIRERVSFQYFTVISIRVDKDIHYDTEVF